MVVGWVRFFLGARVAKNRLEHYVIHLVQQAILAKVHLIVNKSARMDGEMMVFSVA